jgi:hypothetical protein
MSDAVWVAVIALVSGGVGSLIAPWAQWGIEKRREDRAAHRHLIERWRVGLAEWERDPVGPELWPTPALAHRDWYQSLRTHLSVVTRTDIEDTHGYGPLDEHGKSRYYDLLSEAIDRMERTWGLD